MRLFSKIALSILIAVGVALTAHVTFSFALSVLAQNTFKERGPNLRFFDFRSRSSDVAYQFINPQYFPVHSLLLHKGYINDRWEGVPEEDRVLFLGSSVTWGYPMQKDASVSGHYAQSVAPDAVVANVSLIGGTTEQISDIACLASETKMKAKTVFIEVPMINELADLAKKKRLQTLSSCESKQSETSNQDSYLDYFLTKPFGISLLTRTRESNIASSGNRIIKNPIIPKNYRYSVQDIRDKEEFIRQRVRVTLQSAERMGGTNVLFISPVLPAAFEENNVDYAFLRVYENIVMDECAAFAKARCVKTLDHFKDHRTWFYNATHINRDGSLALARLLHQAAQ